MTDIAIRDNNTIVADELVSAELKERAPAITLYKYQKRWLADKSRFKIAMFSRQSGKTFTTTLDLVDDVHEAMVHNKRTTWVMLSRGERQAKEAMETGVTVHAKAYGCAIESISDIDFLGDDGNKYKQLECRFENGSKILALPANPDTARGFAANVFLDEFAFHKDSRKIWTALFPVISNGYKLRITSTPNGKSNKFYDLITDADGVWSKHIVDIYQAVKDGLPRDIALLRKALADDDAWAQEYELKFLDEATAWLSYDLISSVESEYAGLPALYTKNPCYIGVDIGRRKDLFVIWVLEAIGDVLWTREVVELERASFAEQDLALARVFQEYNVVRCCMDQTGMGEKPVEDAMRVHGASRVEGVIFTGSSKLMLATSGKQAFEDRKIRIPMGNDKIRNDLHKLRKEATPQGAPRFAAESDKDGHADRTWACFLGVYAAGKLHIAVPDFVAPPAGFGSRWNGTQHSIDDAEDLEIPFFKGGSKWQ